RSAALGSLGSNLVESGIGKLKGVDCWTPLHHFRQNLQYLRILRSVVGFRVLFRLPEADRHGFPAFRCNQTDFITETILLAERWNDFLFHYVRKLRSGVCLQPKSHMTRKHFATSLLVEMSVFTSERSQTNREGNELIILLVCLAWNDKFRRDDPSGLQEAPSSLLPIFFLVVFD